MCVMRCYGVWKERHPSPNEIVGETKIKILTISLILDNMAVQTTFVSLATFLWVKLDYVNLLYFLFVLTSYMFGMVTIFIELKLFFKDRRSVRIKHA